MMKALKMGFLGLAMGAMGAVAFPANEAAAQQSADQPAKVFVCCSTCNPSYQQCVNSAGNSPLGIAICVASRSYCENNCIRTC